MAKTSKLEQLLLWISVGIIVLLFVLSAPIGQSYLDGKITIPIAVLILIIWTIYLWRKGK